MHRITLDAELRAKLNGLNDVVEICDDNGKVVGRYLPEEEYVGLLYKIARLQPVDEEELRRAQEEPGGMTTTEALAYLNNLLDLKGRDR